LPDPIVEDILLDIAEDEDNGLYKGYDRATTCQRCVDHGYDPPGTPDKIFFAYCNKCMDELDRARYVRAIMRRMRRTSKS
jgi:hypothetical protein